MHLVNNRQKSRPIASVSELREYFLASCKPRAKWRLGTEHEIIGVRSEGGDEPLGSAPPYHGKASIGAVLQALAAGDWDPVYEGQHIIALVRGDAQVTIEPGGQFELAARPVAHTDEMKTDLWQYVGEIAGPSKKLGLAWLSVGFRPFGRLDDVPWMPKQRYRVMREYLPTRGRLAHEMMKRTATVQVNLDYGGPDDAREKLRAIMSATSIITAIYANSPIVDETDSGFQSYRSHVWRHTDPDRCGLLPWVFSDRDIFDAYTEWALDVPLFFVYRDGYRPANGMTFRRFMSEGMDGHQATLDDWALHLSTLFPEARMKKFIEVRGCDAGSMDMVMALAPLCRGLFYDDISRRAVTELTASLDMDERNQLAESVARAGLRADVPRTGRPVGELARELVAIADDGLRRQAPGESSYLEPIRAVVENQRTQADVFLELWRSTGGDPGKIIPRIAHRCLGAE
ncbi:MAG: glutamate-cysteine ligase family protein [Proteobacteria bacterium]|nr:glutamate-cysteine ligase family protein [Pseudomonadota bacterium]